MRATAVVGAGFGDEGKGRTVDALSSSSSLVVRFNGGAQAGHTVQVDGARHVFSHFGSGTLAGAITALSRFFVVEPVTFAIEYKELRRLGLSPSVVVDPLCPVTTPYEIAVNQALERSRGVSRHGSVGVGFGETIEREERGVSFLVCDIPIATSKVARIRDYAFHRLRELDLYPGAGLNLLQEADAKMPRWLECLALMHAEIVVADVTSVIRGYPPLAEGDGIIFEGAQGLLLDQDGAFFPHVTRSKTGLRNVSILAREASIDELKVVYVTRSYLTRHGAGPLPGEDPEMSFPDPTNKPGEFQGSLRFAPLNLPLLNGSIKTDAYEFPGAEVVLAVTCLDQHGGTRFAQEIEDFTRTPVAYEGYGPERQALISRNMTRGDKSCLLSA